jgi:hypothetical protein
MESKEHSAQSEIGRESGPEVRADQHLVVIVVDNQKKKVEAGPYRVSVLKHAVGVPPEKELDQIIHGIIKPLDDNATINIAGNEIFISHERTGAAS